MLRFVIFVLCLECISSVRADDLGCYTSGSVAGIVIASVVVTLVMGGLAAAFIWYLWKQRKVGYGDTKSIDKPIVCPPMSPDKQMIARETNDYAFDNPYFKDDEVDATNPDAAEKGESGFRTDNGDIATSQNAKPSNGTTANHHKKSRPFSSLPFHAVFHPSGKKQQRATMDDTYISKHLERITVPLRGHDFTGLGFNICGNMRDGIFVKDVLHRGPASESGKIKAGDRIIGVTVSFAAMVYEDALTILSYASPYDVRLEIEKSPATSTVSLPSCSPKRLGASTSFRNNEQRRLFHPLYRSQSIDDLTQIGKDGFGLINNSGSQRDSSASATPKRSQSVEASNGGLKPRPPFTIKNDETKSATNKGTRNSSTSSSESTEKAITPTQKSQPDLEKEEVCTKKDVKSARFRAEQVNVKTEAPSKVIPPAKPARDSHDDKHQPDNDILDKTSETVIKVDSSVPAAGTSKAIFPPTEEQGVSENEFNIGVKPTAPPRKSSTPKRRAPAPPPTSSPKEETAAVIHQAGDLQKQSETKEEVPSHDIPPTPAITEITSVISETIPVSNDNFIVTQEIQLTTNELPLFSSSEKIADPGIGSSDTSSLASGDNSSTKMEKDDQNSSPGKRKASSLGDLTKLEHGATKKTSISSAILERAVSLDLQQSIPGENLTKHKKILHAPAFEDDYLEDREDLSELSGQSLKRWDDGLDKVFIKLPNNDGKVNDELKNLNDSEIISEPISIVEIKSIEINSITENIEENGHKPSTECNDTEDDESLMKKSLDIIENTQNNNIIFSTNSETNLSETNKLDDEPIVSDSSTEKSTSDLESDSPIGDLSLPNLHNSSSLLTSTPVKKIIEVKNLILDDDDDDDDKLDDVPYLASSKNQNRDEYSTRFITKTTNNPTTNFSPVTISIPVIKPDLTHFEKLPSPPPASTHPGLEPNWRMTKTTNIDENGKTSLEKITVQSLYKPIFTSKEINNTDEYIHQNNTEKMVNGNDSDTSEHYSTAHENTSTSSLETSSVSVTVSNPVTKDLTKTPNTIAGFAKTLIIPSPNDVQNLLSLAAEPNTPPPILESSSKTAVNE